MKAGFIGLGNIGTNIAKDLVVPGNEVHVYDVVLEASAEFKMIGAMVESSAADVARKVDIVGICVRDDKEVIEVMQGSNGILSAAQPGLLVAIHSTIRPSTVRKLADASAEKGVQVVDVPVTRAPNGPASKGIVFIVGGAAEDVQKVRPYVDFCALKVVETGPLGTAMALKICNNTLTYLTLCAAEDAMNLAEAAGLDLQHLADVTSNNGVASPSLLAAFERRQTGQVHLSFDVPQLERLGDISEKDLDCALEVGRDLGVELPAVAMARQNIRQAFAGWFRKR